MWCVNFVVKCDRVTLTLIDVPEQEFIYLKIILEDPTVRMLL